jgi:DNA polymerase zeta
VAAGRGTLDCKGLEPVRRDACPAVITATESLLRLLFRDGPVDASAAKAYLQAQWSKLHEGRVRVADFVFAKEVRLGTYSSRGPPPPAAVVAARALFADPRAAPRHGERVQYVVVYGPPRARLVDLVVDPLTLLDPSRGLRLNAAYYITRQLIPALERIAHLAGLPVAAWYAEMHRPPPRRVRPLLRTRAGVAWLGDALRPDAEPGAERRDARAADAPRAPARVTLDAYYQRRLCELCGASARESLCAACAADPARAAYQLLQRRRSAEATTQRLLAVCQQCAGLAFAADAAACVSLACPVLYRRVASAALATHLHALWEERGGDG